MIRVHHLRYSRSTRVIWLLEELGEPYELVSYDRDARTMRAPPELRDVHSLGKAPVIEDGGRTIAESGAIIEYLIATYGRGRLGPAPGHSNWPAYIEWLHFGEGTAMLGLIIGLFADGGRIQIYGEESRELALSRIENVVKEQDYLVGGDLTGADIQIFYVLDFAIAFDKLGDRPALTAYHKRLTERPAFRRAIEKGGPVMLPRRKQA